MKQRIFIAFRVPKDTQQYLHEIQEKLKNQNTKAHVSWQKSSAFHITVQFLGEIEEYEVEQVKKVLLDIANTHHGFTYWLDRLGGFPNATHPKIITMHCEEEKRAGYAIHDDLIKKFKELNIIQDLKPWKPHITLGRNRGDTSIQGFETIKFEKKTWHVDTIELIKSDLKHGGSKYTVLESYELKKV